MFTNLTYSSSQRAVTLYCIVTLMHMPTILFFLYYTENVYLIDKYNCIMLIFGLVITECMKYFLCFLFFENGYGTKEVKGQKSKRSFKSKIKECFKSFYLIIGVTGLFYVLAILFGAPVLAEYEETLTFAVLVSTLAIFPSCLNLGADNTMALLTGVKLPLNIIGDMVLKNMQFTLLGAWLGAIVIPLDWDRPWQVWPIPCCTGAVVGYILSHLYTLFKGMPNILTRFYNIIS